MFHTLILYYNCTQNGAKMCYAKIKGQLALSFG